MIYDYREFFEGEDGRLSMSRLLAFMAYFPASIVVAAATYAREWTTAASTAGALLTAYVLQYGVSKFGDVQQTKADKDADPH